MKIVCLDMEGVLTPEIWIEFSRASGIEELKKTTRDEPDYDKLMKWRIALLKEKGMGIKEIRDTIGRLDPLEGAAEFLAELRTFTQVVILSDTFEQFAMPLMEKLSYPVILCNSLEVAPSGEITGYKMRCDHTKLTSVRAFKAMGCEPISVGDSYNDLDMIRESFKGILFRSTDKIKADNPQFEAVDSYADLMAAIRSAL